MPVQATQAKAASSASSGRDADEAAFAAAAKAKPKPGASSPGNSAGAVSGTSAARVAQTPVTQAEIDLENEFAVQLQSIADAVTPGEPELGAEAAALAARDLAPLIDEVGQDRARAAYQRAWERVDTGSTALLKAQKLLWEQINGYADAGSDD